MSHAEHTPMIPEPIPLEKTSWRHQVDDLVFGSVAGMVGKFVEYPFDTVKVRLQTQPLDRPLFSGPLECITATIKQEGIRGLYKGMASPLVGAMLENATLFVGYRQIQNAIRKYSGTEQGADLSLSQLVLAGTASGALASLVLTPVELVKCKLQVQLIQDTPTQKQYTGPIDVMRHIFRQHGLNGFYRGYLATLIREAGGGAFWFGTYEYTCALFIERRQRLSSTKVTKENLSAPELMLGGALGGIAYNLSFFPVDVIKSKMQTDEELLGKAFKQRNFVQTGQDIYRGAGIRGFYRGCGITLLRSAPSNAIIFMTYELLSRHFGAT
ncbi:mitochondrial carrier [Phycomyces nitens]|nr:mitochondrial carrier [Phycomyces nitens]